MSKNDGGPAFPLPIFWDDARGEYASCYEEPGMTLRDYFAAAALQGILAGVADNQPAHRPYYSNGAEIDRADFATTAYQHADAMLKEREK